MSSSKIHLGLLGAFLLGGAFLRIPQTMYGLPAARFIDAEKTVGVSLRLAHQWKEGHLEFDPHYYQYPTLYTYSLAVLNLLTNFRFDSEQMGRTLTAVSTLGVVLVAFVLMIRLASPFAGLLAAALISFGFFFVSEGRYPTLDGPHLFLFSLSLYFLLRQDEINWRDILRSGLFAGLAVGTKYTAFIFLTPILLVVSFCSRPLNLKEKAARIFGWLLITMFIFFLTTPFFLLRFSDFVQSLRAEFYLQQTGMLGTPVPGFWGYLFSQDSVSPDFPFPSSITGFLGWPFLIFSVFYLGWSMFQGIKARNTRLLALSISSLVTYFYFSLKFKLFGLRFLMPWTFMVVLIIVHGFEYTVIRKLNKKAQKIALASAVALLLLIPSLSRDLTYVRQLSVPDSRLHAAEWVFHHIPPGKKILNFLYGPALPSDRYQMVQWTFPENRMDLIDPVNQAPTLKAVHDQKISWVIWNHFYQTPFRSKDFHPLGNVYSEKWQEFYEELKKTADPKLRGEIEGTALSPKIEIFYLPSYEPRL